MSRRFRRRPPPWLWLTLGIAAALGGRCWLDQQGETSTLFLGDAIVSSVIDGQTLEIAARTEGQAAGRVRLLGIQVSDQASARDWLAANLIKKTVRIELDKRRRAPDGAQLAYLYLGSTFVNAELISRGWAKHAPYPGDSASHARRLREATP